MKKILGFALLCFFAAGGFNVSFAQPAAKKALFIIPEKDFQDQEFAFPKAVLEDSGIKVTVASTTLEEITGMEGAKAKADILLKDASVADYDVVVFIGGSGAAQYIDDPLAQGIARESLDKGKITAAICLAPVILAKAGVLQGKKATCYPTNGEVLKSLGVNYTADPLEVDGNIITADGPKSAEQFGRQIAAALKQ